jgi:hypothetical protein
MAEGLNKKEAAHIATVALRRGDEAQKEKP